MRLPAKSATTSVSSVALSRSASCVSGRRSARSTAGRYWVSWIGTALGPASRPPASGQTAIRFGSSDTAHARAAGAFPEPVQGGGAGACAAAFALRSAERCPLRSGTVKAIANAASSTPVPTFSISRRDFESLRGNSLWQAGQSTPSPRCALQRGHSRLYASNMATSSAQRLHRSCPATSLGSSRRRAQKLRRARRLRIYETQPVRERAPEGERVARRLKSAAGKEETHDPARKKEAG